MRSARRFGLKFAILVPFLGPLRICINSLNAPNYESEVVRIINLTDRLADTLLC